MGSSRLSSRPNHSPGSARSFSPKTQRTRIDIAKKKSQAETQKAGQRASPRRSARIAKGAGDKTPPNTPADHQPSTEQQKQQHNQRAEGIKEAHRQRVTRIKLIKRQRQHSSNEEAEEKSQETKAVKVKQEPMSDDNNNNSTNAAMILSSPTEAQQQGSPDDKKPAPAPPRFVKVYSGRRILTVTDRARGVVLYRRARDEGRVLQFYRGGELVALADLESETYTYEQQQQQQEVVVAGGAGPRTYADVYCGGARVASRDLVTGKFIAVFRSRSRSRSRGSGSGGDGRRRRTMIKVW